MNLPLWPYIRSMHGPHCMMASLWFLSWPPMLLESNLLLKLATMDIEIQSQTTISCNGAKAVAIPPALLVDHDGSQWLKLRPTSYQLNQLFFGKSKVNASFSNHPGFQDFIAKRNEAWSKLGTMSDPEDDEANANPRKKEE